MRGKHGIWLEANPYCDINYDNHAGNCDNDDEDDAEDEDGGEDDDDDDVSKRKHGRTCLCISTLSP